jgi:hypothetical protein
MAVSIASVIAEVLHGLGPASSESEAPARTPDIENSIPTACHQLASAARRDPLIRKYLIKDYAITFTAGEAPLASTDILLESVPSARVTLDAGSNKPLVYVPDHQDLDWPKPAAFIYYALAKASAAAGPRLVTLNTDGSATTLSGAATIRGAVFIPVVAALAANSTVPVQLEDQLIEIVTQLARARAGQQPGV